MPSEFTEAQATDLARYFLGPGWIAGHSASNGVIPEYYWVIRNTGIVRLMHTGTSWREAFRKAGVKLPVREEFAAVAFSVVRGSKTICHTTSKSMADRIANALNWYTPGPRGT